MKNVRLLIVPILIAISISCSDANPLEQLSPDVIIRTDRNNYWLPSGNFADTIWITVWNNTTRKIYRLHPYETTQIFDGKNWKRFGFAEILDRDLASGANTRFKTSTSLFLGNAPEGKYRFIGEYIFEGEDTLSHSISNDFYLSIKK